MSVLRAIYDIPSSISVITVSIYHFLSSLVAHAHFLSIFSLISLKLVLDIYLWCLFSIRLMSYTKTFIGRTYQIVWHSVLSLIPSPIQSQSYLQTHLDVHFSVSFSVSSQDSGCHIYAQFINKTANITELTRPSLVHTAAVVLVSQQDSLRVAVRLSFRQYCGVWKCTAVALFVCTCAAFLISNSRQHSLAGTQHRTDGHPSMLHTPSTVILGVMRVIPLLLAYSQHEERTNRLIRAGPTKVLT